MTESRIAIQIVQARDHCFDFSVEDAQHLLLDNEAQAYTWPTGHTNEKVSQATTKEKLKASYGTPARSPPLVVVVLVVVVGITVVVVVRVLMVMIA